MATVKVIGNCTLYLGDCMTVMADIERADHCITDPPYEDEAHSKGRRLLGKQTNGKRTVEYGALDFSAISDADRQIVSRLIAQKCSGWFLAFCQAEAVAAWRMAHEFGGAKYKRAMIWLKRDGAPQFTGDRPGMGYESIVASWCGRGRSKWNGGGKHGIFDHSQRENNSPKQHMTQKPLALMQELVQLFSNEDEIVLDPFMGSGTTGVACAKMNRKFIGIEMDEKHFNTSCKRIDDAYRQGDMFANAPKRPIKQETFL